MSPIEKLKAEATALRENEKAAGRDLKHSEALEQIARKHGYSNWRACVAILSGVTPGRNLPPRLRSRSPQRIQNFGHRGCLAKTTKPAGRMPLPDGWHPN